MKNGVENQQVAVYDSFAIFSPLPEASLPATG
jgi:hypothetical protein